MVKKTATFVMMEDIRKRQSTTDLSEYDEEFLNDIEKKIQWGRRLSEKQEAFLTKLWERSTENG